MHVLLIEDDVTLLKTLARTFTRRGLTVTQCADGASALATWRAQMPDVVVLDLSLPGLDGLEVLSQARAAGLQTPVVITTARGTVGDRILGLNVGADDYVAKPFDLDELEARVRALARRAKVSGSTRADAGGAVNSIGSLSFDELSGAALVNGKPMDLSPRETKLVQALLKRPGQALAKERLYDAVFGNDQDVALDAVEVVAYRVRKKLKDAGSNTQLITLRGLGYLLQDR